MNFISLLQYWLLPPFSTKEMEVTCLVDLPGRRLKHNLNLGQPASRSAAVLCLDTALRKSFQVIR